MVNEGETLCVAAVVWGERKEEVREGRKEVVLHLVSCF